MDPSSRRRGRIGVVASGSVWETRMQSDNEEISNNNNAIVKISDEDKNSSKLISIKDSALGVNGKRRTWKSDVKSTSMEIVGRGNSMKITRARSIGTTPPVTPRRSISSDCNDNKSLTVSVVSAKKTRSDSVEGIEKTPGRVKKIRSELCTAIVKSGEFDSVKLRKVSSLPARDDSEKFDKKKEHVGLPEEKKEEIVNEKVQIQEEVKEFGVCQENVVSSASLKEEDEQIDNGDDEEEDEEEEKKSVDVKEMNVAKENSKNRVVAGDVEVKKYSQFQNRASPSPSSVRKIPAPVIKRATSVYSVPPSPDRFAEEEESFTHSQSKLQSLVDLVMWRDVSRSALVFGFGTFLIISSSYANDLNFSFISVVAYMGLIYLGVTFVLRSVIHRGMVEEEERYKGVGVREEDVKRLLRLIMPYVNESLLQLRSLFSGDPSTTLKMGVVLFVLAKCGSSITLWNLAKFGFLGTFTMPKIFVSYSTHFSAYGKFWVRRFRDAWESCNHKKAMALALFTLVWNLSSVVARIWAAFMLFVALRYYQQKMIWTTTDEDDDEQVEEEEDDEEEEEQIPILKKRDPYTMMPNKLKKNS